MTPPPPDSSASPQGSLQRAARGSVLNLLGAAVAAIATFSIAVLITRSTSGAEAGVFFSATSLFLIAISIGRLGTNTGLVYFISGSRARGDLGTGRRYLRVAAGPVLSVALLTSFALFFGADRLALWLAPEHAESFSLNLSLMAVAVPFAAVANLAAAAAQGLGSMKIFALVDQMLMPALQLGLVGITLLVGWSEGGPSAWAAAYVPVAIVAWLWWGRLSNRTDSGPEKANFVSASNFWKFTVPRGLAGVSQIVMQRLDIVLVGALASLSAAAIYAAATRFLVLGQTAGRAISLSVQPLLATALARGDLRDARGLYQTCTAWLVMGTWPLYLLLINFAPHVLAVFGDAYRSGGPALVLLCSVMLFATACGSVDIVLNMAGKSLWNLMNVLIALAVFLSLDLLLIPGLGFMGAAIGWGAAIVVANALPLLQVLRTPGVHPFGYPSLLTMSVNLVCFGGLPAVATAAGGSAGIGAWGAALGLLLYVAFLVRARRMLQLEVLVQVFRRRRRGGRPPMSVRPG